MKVICTETCTHLFFYSEHWNGFLIQGTWLHHPNHHFQAENQKSKVGPVLGLWSWGSCIVQCIHVLWNL